MTPSQQIKEAARIYNDTEALLEKVKQHNKFSLWIMCFWTVFFFASLALTIYNKSHFKCEDAQGESLLVPAPEHGPVKAA